MTQESPARPLIPPFMVDLDDCGPVVVAGVEQAWAMAMSYLNESPPNSVALITDAAGRLWAMKTTETGEVIDVPF